MTVKPLEIRKTDCFGAGHFNASRGPSRRHIGVDVVSVPGDKWAALNDGKVTKLGYPYADDLTFRYVEVTDAQGWRWRYFYIVPLTGLKVGAPVRKGDVVGICQTLQKRYKGITEHVHVEILGPKGVIDPTPFILSNS